MDSETNIREDNEKSEKIRLFFALIPPDEIKSNIKKYVDNIKFSDNIQNNLKVISYDNYHITLVFIGNVNKILLDKIIKHVEHIKFNDFEINLNKVGLFDRSKVFWLGPKASYPELDLLVDKLKINLSQIKELDFLYNNKSFTPHLSLVKKIKDFSDIANYKEHFEKKLELSWQVDKFCLVESVNKNNSVRYEIIKEFKG